MLLSIWTHIYALTHTHTSLQRVSWINRYILLLSSSRWVHGDEMTFILINTVLTRVNSVKTLTEFNKSPYFRTETKLLVPIKNDLYGLSTFLSTKLKANKTWVTALGKSDCSDILDLSSSSAAAALQVAWWDTLCSSRVR